MNALLPYLVHSCSCPANCAESCDGVVVFASGPGAAAYLAPALSYEGRWDEVEAQLDRRLECLRPLANPDGVVPSPWGPVSEEVARLWRQAGWASDEIRCMECDQGEWVEVPESALCECGICLECGGHEECSS